MALVTITGNAWDGDRDPIPAANEPELFFRPLSTSMMQGLLTDREVPAEAFNLATGAFTVELESVPGLMYIPILRWLKNPEDPMNRGRGQAEWKPFYPGTGGPISQLPPVVQLGGVWYGFGAPPTVLRSRNDSIYLDITGPGVGVWVPEKAAFAEGVTV